MGGPAAGRVAGGGRARHGGAGEEQVPGGPVPRGGGGGGGRGVVPLAAVDALVRQRPLEGPPAGRRPGEQRLVRDKKRRI